MKLERNQTLSHDRLADELGEGGKDEVFATTFPDARQRWQISRDGGSFPRWQGDEREVYYARKDAILAVEVGPTGMPLGEPRELFRRPVTGGSEQWPDGFDVTRDGRRFVIAEHVGADEGPQPAVVVVQSWFAEFAR